MYLIYENDLQFGTEGVHDNNIIAAFNCLVPVDGHRFSTGSLESL